MATEGDPDWIDHGPAIGHTWIANPSERMLRASHLLSTDRGLLAVEPVDAPGLDDAIDERGELTGVLVLMDRHSRDSDTIAERYDIPVYIPEAGDRVASKLDVPLEPVEHIAADLQFEMITLVNNRWWQEWMLWNPENETAIVPETLGTGPYFRAGSEAVGVHPMIRLFPPRKTLRRFTPSRLLVGHGYPVDDIDRFEYRQTVSLARRRLPRALASAIRR